MLGVIATTEVLDMLSVDAEDTYYGESVPVREVLDRKRKSEHYTGLLEKIHANGMELPIIIRMYDGVPWLVDGHHRVAAAVELGMTSLVWSDLPVELEDCTHNPTHSGDWGPYRPAA